MEDINKRNTSSEAIDRHIGMKEEQWNLIIDLHMVVRVQIWIIF